MQKSLEVIIKSLEMERERSTGSYKYKGIAEIGKDEIIFEIFVNQNIYVNKDNGELGFISLMYPDIPGFNQNFKLRDFKIVKGADRYGETIANEFNRQYSEQLNSL